MNKKKGIIIGVLALMVTMMVGYAIFSETITINGTATAKGDFNIETTCVSGISNDLYGDNIIYSPFYSSDLTLTEQLSKYPEGSYKNDSCVVKDNNVSLNSELSMPGARRYFTVKVTNKGSIPVTFDLVQMEKLLPIVTIEGTVTSKYDEVKNLTTNDFTDTDDFAGIFGQGYDAGVEEDYILDTGESFYFILYLAFPEKLKHHPDGGGFTDYLTHAKSADLKIGLKMGIPLKQVTAS